MNVSMRAADFMATDLHCVRPDDDIMTAVHRLVSLNISGLLVVDEQRKLLGILTERDCIEVALQAGYFDEKGGRGKEYMSTELQTVNANESLMDVAVRFARGAHRRFPVLDHGELVGLIARRDILRALTAGAWFDTPAAKGSQP